MAIKDSSGDWSNTKAYIDTVPDLDVFPGSEAFLLRGLHEGAAGCISGTCNINAAAIRSVYEQAMDPGVETLNDEMLRVRRLVEAAGLMPACKWLLADASGEPALGRVSPPLLPLAGDKAIALKDALGPTFKGLASLTG